MVQGILQHSDVDIRVVILIFLVSELAHVLTKLLIRKMVFLRLLEHNNYDRIMDGNALPANFSVRTQQEHWAATSLKCVFHRFDKREDEA